MTEKDNEIRMADVFDHPDRYIEVNIKGENRIFTNLFIYAKEKQFEYKRRKYTIDPNCIYVLPKKQGFIPTIFYKEGDSKPLSFKNTNKGIPARAMSLLWNLRLYRQLVIVEDKNINWLLVVVVLAQCILLGVGIYLRFFHTGPLFP